MKLIENIHHSDECSGTTIVETNSGVQYRAHWTEGYSDVIICEGRLGGPIVGIIHANGETSHEAWEQLKAYLLEPSVSARPMTEEEEKDHEGAIGSQV
jgi:hypothetical protein